MPEAASLTKVKLRLGIPTATTTYDALLTDFLSDAESYLLGRTNQATLPTALLALQCKKAAAEYKLRGLEGQSIHSEGGISVTVEVFSDADEKLINSYRLCRIVDTLTAPEEAE